MRSDFPTEPDRGESPVGSVVATAEYALAYLAAPLGVGYVAVELSQVVAMGSLLWLLAITRAGWSRRWPGAASQRAILTWGGLAVFAASVAGVTAIGRAPEMGVRQALDTRYHSLSGFWWIALLVLTAATWPMRDHQRLGLQWRGGRPGTSREITASHLLVVTAIFLCALGANIGGFLTGIDAKRLLRWNEGCVLEYRQAAENCLQLYHPNPAVVRNGAAYLEEHRLGLFRDLPPASPVAPPQMISEATFDLDRPVVVGLGHRRNDPIVLPADRDLRLSGWAAHDGSASSVIVSTDTGLRFRAVSGLSRPDTAATLGNQMAKTAGFSAVIAGTSLQPGRHVLSFTVVFNDGEIAHDPPQEVVVEVRE